MSRVECELYRRSESLKRYQWRAMDVDSRDLTHIHGSTSLMGLVRLTVRAISARVPQLGSARMVEQYSDRSIRSSSS